MNNKRRVYWKLILLINVLFCNMLVINQLCAFPLYSFIPNPQNSQPFTIHDFHSSIAEVNFNEKNKSLEVSLRVFTDDLELALAKSNGLSKIYLDETKKYNDLINKYIATTFYFLDTKNVKQSHNFIGKELEGDVTWIYFEIPLKKAIKGFQLRNAVLTELFEDQSNMVNMTYKKQKQTFIFKRGYTTQTLEFSL
jgi:hypothetical protein